MSGNRLIIQSQLPPVVFVQPKLRIRFRRIRSLCHLYKGFGQKIKSDSHETWKCVDAELQRQIRCFPYVELSDVTRLQQVGKKAVGRQRNLGLVNCMLPKLVNKICLCLCLSSRYVFLYVICFRIIHFILISTAHALFLTCLPVSISGT